MRFVLAFTLVLAAVALQAQEAFKPLEFMIGSWEGTSSGEPGEGRVKRTCAKVLNDRFIECRTTVTYAKEVHNDVGYYSYDKVAKTLRLRQFHGEGFVNTYEQGEALVFTTTEIENIPAGWRARETYEHPNADEWRERFELAEPGKPFELYSASALRRVQ